MVTGTWQTGIMALTGARLVARPFNGVARSCRRSHICWIGVLLGHQNDMGAMGSLTLFTSTMLTIVFLGWVSIIVVLEEILEIFKGVIIKVALTMVHIILDVVLWKRIKKII